ncbi:GNAT family N-acetyltransferase [Blastococcus sp. TF02A-26]|uniref:GNAT family N-acetyltransferase n=1 Tax=Blastococcus sp. TF02A-26 TaxID=2250577 RepID=UPI000DE8EA63|nr:GNAT family N-acetyltransferase [Blastococcus sp. TF02A-26]RBY88681.1 GNAT family N-acetyltransferase [Blastococcus sp. TF02A-26]
MRVEQTAWDDPDVRALTAAQQAELRARYDGGTEPGTPPSAADVAVVLVARDDDGTPVGCGALRPIGPGVAEIKRMYVVPAARGRGVSRAVLAALETAAVARGWTTVRLETGTRQPEAIGLYESAGYRAIPAFGAYVASDDPFAVFYERVLADA